MEDQEQSLINHRLTQVEKAIESSIFEINRKLDQLLALQNEIGTKAILAERERQILHERVRGIEDRIEKELLSIDKKLVGLEQTSTALQVNLAQKIGPGAIAGAAVAAMMWLGKALFGV